jgi:ABC-type sugar transport system ATPase subunit
VEAKIEIYKIMNELTKTGVSIVMVSSDLPELVAMSDRCLILSNSKITGEFTGRDITQDNVMKAALLQ